MDALARSNESFGSDSEIAFSCPELKGIDAASRNNINGLVSFMVSLVHPSNQCISLTIDSV